MVRRWNRRAKDEGNNGRYGIAAYGTNKKIKVMSWGLLIMVAVLGVWIACVLKAEGGETYEDRQQKMADKMFGDKEKGDD